MSTQILTGDCREVLKTLPNESIHCVVTSPPYWGLRDYGTAEWEGGDPYCDHQPRNGRQGATGERADRTFTGTAPFKVSCALCGAIRNDQQIGLEPTLDEHIEVIVGVFREVKRVLRKDGTVWMNYGDCYAASQNGRSTADVKAEGNDDRTFRDKPFSTVGGVLKPKDLCMMPHRVAIALQCDGWWVRSDIVWSKPNPMPESIRDRPTRSHEYVFLLAKSERYFYDAWASRESCLSVNGRSGNASLKCDVEGERSRTAKTAHRGTGIPWRDETGKRNRRTVWEIAPEPMRDAHFATFPTALVKPCIMAGTSERGCCAGCGAPWRRETQPTEEYARHLGRDWANDEVDDAEGRGHFTLPDGTKSKQRRVKRKGESISAAYETTGWSPTCECGDVRDPMPCVVLDPFGGSGTVGRVAADLGRASILIELNPAYVKIAEKRISQKTLML